MRNFERIIEWCEAVKLMCNISANDYEHYVAKQIYKIEDEHLQTAIQSYAFNFGIILTWIELGITKINNDKRLPTMCAITENISHIDYAEQWQKHIDKERQVMDCLCKSATCVMTVCREKVKKFYEEESDEYSSYSDYSEDTSTSEEEPCEELDEEENDDYEREKKENRKR
jgi:hypothetical protein